MVFTEHLLNVENWKKRKDSYRSGNDGDPEA